MIQTISSSLQISGSIQTLSLIGNGQQVFNIQSASYAPTASMVEGDVEIQGFPYTGSAKISGLASLTGSFTIENIKTSTTSSNNTLVLDNETVKQQPIPEYGIKGLQPSTDKITGSINQIDLGIQTYNWFDINVSSSLTASFSTGSNPVYEFDLVWTNTEFTTADAGGYNIQSASHDSITYDVSGQEGSPQCFTFNDDGTKLYTGGYADDTIYEYNITDPNDISTATYSGRSYYLGSSFENPASIAFNNDGTMFFALSLSFDSVRQYSLSTPYNISTATYNSEAFEILDSIEVNPSAVSFSGDGTKMYIAGNETDSIYQYNLGTAFDVTTAVYSNISVDVSSQTTAPHAIRFNNKGDKAFVIGYFNSVVYQYSLSTPFDLSSISFDNIEYDMDINPGVVRSVDVVFNSNGSKMFVLDEDNGNIFQFSTGEGSETTLKNILSFSNTIQWEEGSSPTLSNVGKKDWFRFNKIHTDGEWLGKVIQQDI